MAGDVVIRIEDVGKKYRIRSSKQQRYDTLRDSIHTAVKSLLKGNFSSSKAEDFWALQHINMEINQGDRVALIGHNGAGKSTLLKILSQITEPTVGRVSIKGALTSLLEVGTGFHPELTGRENIFLNGSIMGMPKHDIRKQLDAIVDFSGIERFLDTPLKRYSSGMQTRLGFAVAAHLQSDIMIIDEVLAVGDAAFQQKCIGKMNELSKSEGKTIIVVSHSMRLIESLCKKGFVLNKGHCTYAGGLSDSIEHYMQAVTVNTADSDLKSYLQGLDWGELFQLDNITFSQDGLEVKSETGEITMVNNLPIKATFFFTAFKELGDFRFYFIIRDSEFRELFFSFHDDDSMSISPLSPGKYTLSANIPELVMGGYNGSNRYILTIGATRHHGKSFIPKANIHIPFLVDTPSSALKGKAYLQRPIFRDVIAPSIEWSNIEEA